MNKPDKLAKNKVSNFTQQFLDISEIRENTVILRDGSMRSVILASSINFALKSEDEQNAIISGYVGFLNNLEFPLQVVVQSRELDIDNYINSLRQKEKEQTNELLKVQTAEYMQYVQELISLGKIMNKRFYAVVPYNPSYDKHKNFFGNMVDIFRPISLVKVKEKVFRRRRNDLTKRVESVISGLASIGIGAIELDTQGLIEIFYNIYNPDTSANQKMASSDKLGVEENLS